MQREVFNPLLLQRLIDLGPLPLGRHRRTLKSADLVNKIRRATAQPRDGPYNCDGRHRLRALWKLNVTSKTFQKSCREIDREVRGGGPPVYPKLSDLAERPAANMTVSRSRLPRSASRRRLPTTESDGATRIGRSRERERTGAIGDCCSCLASRSPNDGHACIYQTRCRRSPEANATFPIGLTLDQVAERIPLYA